MMSNNVKDCLINFEKDVLQLDMMKHGNRKKRNRDIEAAPINHFISRFNDRNGIYFGLEKKSTQL